MRAFKVIVSCLAFASVATGAIAQDGNRPRPAGDQPAGDRPPRGERGPGAEGGPRGMGRPALSPEKAKAAWEAQANGVSKRIGLNDEQTKAVAKAYTEARESHTKAQEKVMTDMRDKMRDADDRRAAMTEMQKAVEETNKTEREKFQKALTASISTEQATKVIASLGTFNRQWDGIVDVVTGFKLEAEKQQTVLNAVEDFVVAQAKQPRFGAGSNDDQDAREAAREAARENREKVVNAAKAVLSEEQLEKFEGSLRGPGGPGGPGGRRGPGGPGGPGGEGGGRRDREPGGQG